MNPLPGTTSREVLRALGEYAATESGALAIAELDDRGVISTANQAFERLAGRALTGVPVAELVAPAQREALADALAAAGSAWQRRLLGLFPDKHGIPLDFLVSLRRAGGGVLLVGEAARESIASVNERLLTLTDELARAQRHIRHQNAELEHQNERLRELDQVKDALLASVSHDLRTPLTAILGYAELMRRRGGLSDHQARAADVIERNARRLLRLVNDLLLMAQLRAGGLQLEPESVELAQLVSEAVELARPLADQSGLSLELSVPAPGTIVVSGDRLRLGQLLDNLIANAIKFTPSGGHVRVGVRRTGETACLEVEDDGPGIAPEARAGLYDPFVRGPGATAAGTGLGLAIVQAVAAAHGGTIELDTEAGRGTRFAVSLPLGAH